MARKDYTAVSLEPDAITQLRLMRTEIAASIGADITLSDAVCIARLVIKTGMEIDSAARRVLA